ncbi:hypothetical protein NADFUDRAFT_39365 [Nadsonia fulvescens var. elongata DSM 6958]|uniref:Uncharacterized protein n=1 Tax=Nadsonia fulvescens var. elongata DSM 6958 TaxID=857566 RepID=A0A1E3PRP1_9ASCO|nr:hypothetical protein NADFUDRAFT_39365 [Nadsonia fulvescens var. elongata DSM 6958]
MAFSALVFKYINTISWPEPVMPISVSSAIPKSRSLSSKSNSIKPACHESNFSSSPETPTIYPGKAILSTGHGASLPPALCCESANISYHNNSKELVQVSHQPPGIHEVCNFYKGNNCVEDSALTLTRINSFCSTIVNLDNDTISIKVNEPEINMNFNVCINTNVDQDRPEMYFLEETDEAKYQIVSDNDDDGLDSDEECILNDIMDSQIDYMSVTTNVTSCHNDDSGTLTLVDSSDYGDRSSNAKRLDYYRAFSIRSKQISMTHKVSVVLFVILVAFKHRGSRRRMITIVQKLTQDLVDKTIKTASIFTQARYFVRKRLPVALRSESKNIMSPIRGLKVLKKGPSSTPSNIGDWNDQGPSSMKLGWMI